MGEVGKTYALSATNEGETYTSKTSILAPTPPVTSYWLTEPGTPNHGYSRCALADPPNQFDGLTFNFCYENRFAYGSTPDEFRGFYEMGDTVGIKLPK